MNKKIFLSKKNEPYLDNIGFKRVSELISFQQIYDSIHKNSRFTLSIIGGSVILLEILIAASFSGLVFKKPIFAIIEWLIMLVTLFLLLKINFGVKSKKYLTKYFSRCSVIISICSFILSLSTWIIFLSFSGEMTKAYAFQILIQVCILAIACLLLEGLIYLYLKSKVIEELAIYVKEIQSPLFVKIVEKSIGFIIALIFIAMQFYRVNKFWITHSTSWMTTILIPLIQFILFILGVLVLLILPVKIFYPEIVKKYLLSKYSEEFRQEYDFTKEEWYGE